MARLGSPLLALALVSGIASNASAQPQSTPSRSFAYDELVRARAVHTLAAFSLEAKPGRGPRRSLSRQQLRALATAARGVQDGTPVIGVSLYLPGGNGASRAASQSMANQIVRQLESLGCPPGSVLAYGFGADRYQVAMNRVRGVRHSPTSRVELFRVPTGGMPLPQVDRFRSEVTPLVRSLAPRLVSCAPTNRIVTLHLTFDANGRITQVDSPGSVQETMCYRVNLVGETLGTPPGEQRTITIPLALRRN